MGSGDHVTETAPMECLAELSFGGIKLEGHPFLSVSIFWVTYFLQLVAIAVVTLAASPYTDPVVNGDANLEVSHAADTEIEYAVTALIVLVAFAAMVGKDWIDYYLSSLASGTHS